MNRRRAGNIDHTAELYHRQSFESATHKTGGGYWTCSEEFASIPYWIGEIAALEEVMVTELLSYQFTTNSHLFAV